MSFKLVHSVYKPIWPASSDRWKAPLYELNVAMVTIQALCIHFQYSSKCGHPISHVNIVWTPRIRQTIPGEEIVSRVSRLLWLWVRHYLCCLCTSSVCFCCHFLLREVRCNLNTVHLNNFLVEGLYMVPRVREKPIFFSISRKSQGTLYEVRKIVMSTSKSVNRQAIFFWLATMFGKGLPCWQR